MEQGGAVSWGITLQAKRSRVRFYIDLIRPDALRRRELTQPLTRMSTKGVPRGLRQPVRGADIPTTFMCRLSRTSKNLNLHKLQGISRPVQW